MGKNARLVMFIRLITAAFTNRRSRMAVMLVSIMLGGAVVSGLVSIYRDLETQVGQDMRGYGANFVLIPRTDRGSIGVDRADRAALAFGDRLVGYSPYLYGRSRLGGADVVLVGMRLDQLSKVSPYLQIKGRPGREKGAIVGERLAERLGLAVGQSIEIAVDGKQQPLTVSAVVSSGGVEEDQVFVDLAVAQDLLYKEGMASMAYFNVITGGDSAEKITKRIAPSITPYRLEAITRISEGETKVLSRIKNLVFLVAGVIFVTSALSVATTMMAVVIERRREVGLKKALGAENRRIMAEFLGEGAVLGLFGGTAGWFFGYLAAQWVGRSVFDSYISFSFSTILISITTSLVIATVALIVPVRLALAIEPAVVLRGE